MAPPDAGFDDGFLNGYGSGLARGEGDCFFEQAGLIDAAKDSLGWGLAMVYEGTVIGDGKESLDIIADVESVLSRRGISRPDYTKVRFSSGEKLNGWGNNFDGRFLSIIL